MWTLVGAGIKKVDQSAKLMSDVLPQECVHYQQKVAEFNPEANEVTLSNGEVVSIILWCGSQLFYFSTCALNLY